MERDSYGGTELLTGMDGVKKETQRATNAYMLFYRQRLYAKNAGAVLQRMAHSTPDSFVYYSDTPFFHTCYDCPVAASSSKVIVKADDDIVQTVTVIGSPDDVTPAGASSSSGAVADTEESPGIRC